SAGSDDTTACRYEYLASMLFSSLRAGGLVAGPERLREFVTHVLSPEADVLEQMVAELLHLLPRVGAGTPQPDGGDDPSDRRERRDTPSLDTWRHALCKPRFRWRRNRRSEPPGGIIDAKGTDPRCIRRGSKPSASVAPIIAVQTLFDHYRIPSEP